MKKILISSLLIISVLFSSAQSTNPLNQVGIDFIASFKIIFEDLTKETITNLSPETIKHYTEVLPSEINLNDTTAMQIYVETNNNLDFDSVVNNSSYSTNAKNDIKQIKTAMYTQSIDTLQAYLTLKADSINNNNTSYYSSADKVMLLTQIAIIYNMVPDITDLSRSAPANPIPCSHDSNIEGACIIGAGIVGYFVGNAICGTPCGIGGAIIFAAAAVVAYVLS